MALAVDMVLAADRLVDCFVVAVAYLDVEEPSTLAENLELEKNEKKNPD